MARSFGIVDAKVAEANFFLGCLEEAGANFFKARCYFSAYISSARSITYAIQASIKEVPGFEEWYDHHQEILRRDPLSRFFHEARVQDHHVGLNLVAGGSLIHSQSGPRNLYHFASTGTMALPPEDDVVEACKKNLASLVALVYDCYRHFGDLINPHHYYTKECFEKNGLSIEDAEEEVFGFRGWTECPEVPLEERWRLIREPVSPCNINHIFEKYLGKSLQSHVDQ